MKLESVFPDCSGSSGCAALKLTALNVISGGEASEMQRWPTPLYQAPVAAHRPSFRSGHASPAHFCLCYLFLLIHGPILFVSSRRCFNQRYHREVHQIKNRAGSPYESAAFPDLYQSNLERPRREESAFQQSDGGWSKQAGCAF